MRRPSPHLAARVIALGILAAAAAAPSAYATFPGENGRIAYVNFYAPPGTHFVGGTVFSITPLGTNPLEIAGNLDFAPRWSPDGSRLALEFEPPNMSGVGEDIAVVDADGSNLTPITHDL